MFKINEVFQILLVIILFAFIINFLSGLETFLFALLIAFIIISVNVITKKMIASSIDLEIEQKILQFQRWGFYKRSKLKKSIPFGLILPFFMLWLSYPTGFFKMFTFLQYDLKPTKARAAKKHGGLYRFSELTEFHIALPAIWATVATLLLAVLAYLLNFPDLARYSIYYSAWNLIPFGQLDGCKMFFGSKLWWLFFVIMSILGIILSFIMI